MLLFLFFFFCFFFLFLFLCFSELKLTRNSAQGLRRTEDERSSRDLSPNLGQRCPFCFREVRSRCFPMFLTTLKKKEMIIEQEAEPKGEFLPTILLIVDRVKIFRTFKFTASRVEFQKHDFSPDANTTTCFPQERASRERERREREIKGKEKTGRYRGNRLERRKSSRRLTP